MIKKKIFIFLSIFIAASSTYAMQPEEINPENYEFDNFSDSTRCLFTVLKKCHMFLVRCEYIVNPTANKLLTLAAHRIDEQALQTALRNGGDINNPDPSFRRYTPLHHLTHALSLKGMELLLKNNADPNRQDTYGDTPAHIAVLAGYAPGLALLMKYNARLDIRNNNRETPQQLAERFNYHNCLQAFADGARARALLQQKIAAENRAKHLLAQMQQEQKKQRAAARLTRLIQPPQLTPEQKQEELEKRKKLEQAYAADQEEHHRVEQEKRKKIEIEQAHAAAKQHERYLAEFKAGKKAAQAKHEQFKHKKH